MYRAIPSPNNLRVDRHLLLCEGRPEYAVSALHGHPTRHTHAQDPKFLVFENAGKRVPLLRTEPLDVLWGLTLPTQHHPGGRGEKAKARPHVHDVSPSVQPTE